MSRYLAVKVSKYLVAVGSLVLGCGYLSLLWAASLDLSGGRLVGQPMPFGLVRAGGTMRYQPTSASAAA